MQLIHKINNLFLTTIVNFLAFLNRLAVPKFDLLTHYIAFLTPPVNVARFEARHICSWPLLQHLTAGADYTECLDVRRTVFVFEFCKTGTQFRPVKAYLRPEIFIMSGKLYKRYSSQITEPFNLFVIKRRPARQIIRISRIVTRIVNSVQINPCYDGLEVVF